MLTFDQIKELVDLVVRNRLHGLEIEQTGFRLKISGEAAVAPPRETVVLAAPAAPAGQGAAATTSGTPVPAAEPAAPAGSALHVVTSPIVGTFYAAPSPDAQPFVRVGDRVRKGQVLCIVEAMKLMNEIESDADGVIGEIYPKNAQPVEFGEALFGIHAD